MEKRRVVITGMGVISSLGLNLNDFWSNIKSGKNGITLVERFNVENLPTKVAAVIKDFEPSDFMDGKEARRLDKYAQFAVAAAFEAYGASGLDKIEFDKTRMGVHVSSGIGGLETIEQQHNVFSEKGGKRMSPFTVTMMIANMGAGKIAIDLGAKGPAECVVTACASSTYAVGNAFRLIQWGDADVVVAGGSEAPITEFAMSAFAANRSISFEPDPNRACLPFDTHRSGFVMGEGGAILILEELEHALSRGAEIIAEIAGYGATCDAYHFTAPDPEGDGAYRCMENAIKDAGITPADIQYINAHGTGTQLNDKTETMAIRRLFGDAEKNISVSATKSMTGHSLGAIGALEAIITAQSVREGFVPPTINTTEIDPECNLSGIVLGNGINRDLEYALSNSFGFGGHNASLVIRKYR
ncbi:MAG: beta-ketoacyl-ACP synthase II [Clostridia bacterium]|nr:beta-ketoacyl-ACP synthase II [Clostridia bacterium]